VAWNTGTPAFDLAAGIAPTMMYPGGDFLGHHARRAIPVGSRTRRAHQ
jgi:hypothetical protein